MCASCKKQTNHYREIGTFLVKGMIPKSWHRYTTSTNVTVYTWMPDFSCRIGQLSKLIEQSKNLKSFEFWLGGLFMPDAFIYGNAPMPRRSRHQSCVEQSATSVTLKSLTLHGAAAKVKDNKLRLGPSVVTDLKKIRQQWNKKDKKDSSLSEVSITLPVYLNF